MGQRIEPGSELPPMEAELFISGPFDPLAAARLRLRLDELPAGSRVVVDFARAAEVSDLALAVLARAAAARSPAIVLRGLARHHERLLRYLGMGAAARPPA